MVELIQKPFFVELGQPSQGLINRKRGKNVGEQLIHIFHFGIADDFQYHLRVRPKVLLQVDVGLKKDGVLGWALTGEPAPTLDCPAAASGRFPRH